MVVVTSFYAGLLALLFLVLTARVIFYRRGNLISMGDKGDNELLTRMRGHGNFAEYAPMGLLLLGLAELQGAPALALHVLGLMLLSGRGLHALAFAGYPPKMNLRVPGMALTILMIAFTGLGLVLHSLF